MKKLTQIALVSMATLAFIGCNNRNKDNAELKSSSRNVKFLVDTDGMSLYTFDKDGLNTSNCTEPCQEKWPLFEGANTGSENIKVLEGSDHLAYRKHPLYYFAGDTIAGDVLGDNKKWVWHLVYAPAGTTDSQTGFSEAIAKQVFLTDKDQRALYTFDKDDTNTSHCYDSTPTSSTGCESAWPVFYSSDLGALPTGTTASDFGVIDRDATKTKQGEPTQQVTYKGKTTLLLHSGQCRGT